MRYMLDTNICIYLIKNDPAHVAKKFAHLNYGDAVISVITLAELRFGAFVSKYREQEEQAILGLLEDIPVLSFDETITFSYAKLRAALPDRRKDALDRLIAAHAVAADCILVTNNEADFKGYPNLTWENWVSGC
ncbi:type II toxin-antitoxin system VapC family toxin [Acinetobacter populi]|uniref:Ribonuclease VapC n=1 Tax=Acinetobacter populi TaxID=1582270 RepID=A0A1Z9Z1C3_9GAMM|nr:type II toxin-antitoxin system VapC family toxin [Acinetobacter populi]OUY08227.1 VapC toxin family PIN domain ribonuclease [Acinetobacter populi]